MVHNWNRTNANLALVNASARKLAMATAMAKSGFSEQTAALRFQAMQCDQASRDAPGQGAATAPSGELELLMVGRSAAATRVQAVQRGRMGRRASKRLYAVRSLSVDEKLCILQRFCRRRHRRRQALALRPPPQWVPPQPTLAPLSLSPTRLRRQLLQPSQTQMESMLMNDRAALVLQSWVRGCRVRRENSHVLRTYDRRAAWWRRWMHEEGREERDRDNIAAALEDKMAVAKLRLYVTPGKAQQPQPYSVLQQHSKHTKANRPPPNSTKEAPWEGPKGGVRFAYSVTVQISSFLTINPCPPTPFQSPLRFS